MVCNELIGNAAPKTVSASKFEYLPSHSRVMIKRWFNNAYENIGGNNGAIFDGFIHCWMAFNAWGTCVTETETDAQMVNSLISYDEFNDLWNSLTQDSASPLHVAAQEFRTVWPIFNAVEAVKHSQGLPSRTDRRQIVPYYLQHVRRYQPKCHDRHQDEQGYPLDWPHTLKTIYQVRCNLFHGWKDYETEMDQRIVGLSFQILARFIKAAKIFE